MTRNEAIGIILAAARDHALQQDGDDDLTAEQIEERRELWEAIECVQETS